MLSGGAQPWECRVEASQAAPHRRHQFSPKSMQGGTTSQRSSPSPSVYFETTVAPNLGWGEGREGMWEWREAEPQCGHSQHPSASSSCPGVPKATWHQIRLGDGQRSSPSLMSQGGTATRTIPKLSNSAEQVLPRRAAPGAFLQSFLGVGRRLPSSFTSTWPTLVQIRPILNTFGRIRPDMGDHWSNS